MGINTSEQLKLDPLNNGRLLDGIFKYQESLVNKYIELGRLPAMPLDINKRESQKFLRKLINDFNEELAEASVEIDNAMGIMSLTVYKEEPAQSQIIEHLKKAAIEMADALHFLVELMIYTNIGPGEIESFYKNLLFEKELGGLIGGEPLRTTFAYSQHLNIYDDLARTSRYMGFTFPGLDYNNIFVASKLGPDVHNQFEIHFWFITKTLLTAQNFLKMKDWRAEEVNASVQSFQDKVMDAWVAFFKLVDLLSLDDSLLYTAYEEKNFINQERIKTGY